MVSRDAIHNGHAVRLLLADSKFQAVFKATDDLPNFSLKSKPVLQGKLQSNEATGVWDFLIQEQALNGVMKYRVIKIKKTIEENRLHPERNTAQVGYFEEGDSGDGLGCEHKGLVQALADDSFSLLVDFLSRKAAEEAEDIGFRCPETLYQGDDEAPKLLLALHDSSMADVL